MAKYTQLAADIVKNVGGKENANSLAHFIILLRFKLNSASYTDISPIDD